MLSPLPDCPGVCSVSPSEMWPKPTSWMLLLLENNNCKHHSSVTTVFSTYMLLCWQASNPLKLNMFILMVCESVIPAFLMWTQNVTTNSTSHTEAHVLQHMCYVSTVEPVSLVLRIQRSENGNVSITIIDMNYLHHFRVMKQIFIVWYFTHKVFCSFPWHNISKW